VTRDVTRYSRLLKIADEITHGASSSQPELSRADRTCPPLASRDCRSGFRHWADRSSGPIPSWIQLDLPPVLLHDARYDSRPGLFPCRLFRREERLEDTQLGSCVHPHPVSPTDSIHLICTGVVHDDVGSSKVSFPPRDIASRELTARFRRTARSGFVCLDRA